MSIKNSKGKMLLGLGLLILLVSVAVVAFALGARSDRETKNDTRNTEVKEAVNTEVKKEDATKNTEMNSKPLEKGTFGEEGDFGNFQVEGYATTVKRNNEPCGDMCKEYDYVFFNIVKSENAKVFEYIKSNVGNSFVQDGAIGMGCKVGDTISYSNASDAGSAEYVINQADTQKILAATKDNPIRLSVERLKYTTGGSGAPTCYSHFATFKVVE